ncbi:EF-hand calcium-binding domain protein [Rutstroemia sp. NJR-2017a WRK4]|nr:EF-hand calcium-binding domain protein [Rutstroemia sp. NJR-2017a WRK4]
MRFLCLHGRGTSPEIFRIQLASLRNHLAVSQPHTYDFLPGAYPTSPAPGIAPFFPDGPYLSHFPSPPSPSGIRSALSHLSTYITQHGPYDGVLAFSQGCALLSTFLLSLSHQHQPLPFKFAVFICGGPSLSFLEHELGIVVPEQAYEIDARSRNELDHTAGKLETVLANPELLSQNPGAGDYWGESARAEGSVLNQDMDMDYGVRVGEEEKIGMRTVHVIGKKDPRRWAGRCLVGLCREGEENRRVWEFEGGHEVPRKGEAGERLGGLVRWAAGEGE